MLDGGDFAVLGHSDRTGLLGMRGDLGSAGEKHSDSKRKKRALRQRPAGEEP